MAVQVNTGTIEEYTLRVDRAGLQPIISGKAEQAPKEEEGRVESGGEFDPGRVVEGKAEVDKGGEAEKGTTK